MDYMHRQLQHEYVRERIAQAEVARQLRKVDTPQPTRRPRRGVLRWTALLRTS